MNPTKEVLYEYDDQRKDYDDDDKDYHQDENGSSCLQLCLKHFFIDVLRSLCYMPLIAGGWGEETSTTNSVGHHIRRGPPLWNSLVAWLRSRERGLVWMERGGRIGGDWNN